MRESDNVLNVSDQIVPDFTDGGCFLNFSEKDEK